MDACGGTILIVLDEIDGLDEDEDDLLYEIPRAVSQGNATECKPGIIGVTNDYNLTDSFARRHWTRFVMKKSSSPHMTRNHCSTS